MLAHFAGAKLQAQESVLSLLDYACFIVLGLRGHLIVVSAASCPKELGVQRLRGSDILLTEHLMVLLDVGL
jgi:hypothetical protein